MTPAEPLSASIITVSSRAQQSNIYTRWSGKSLTPTATYAMPVAFFSDRQILICSFWLDDGNDQYRIVRLPAFNNHLLSCQMPRVAAGKRKITLYQSDQIAESHRPACLYSFRWSQCTPANYDRHCFHQHFYPPTCSINRFRSDSNDDRAQSSLLALDPSSTSSRTSSE